jgi:hypothetical protein
LREFALFSGNIRAVTLGVKCLAPNWQGTENWQMHAPTMNIYAPFSSSASASSALLFQLGKAKFRANSRVLPGPSALNSSFGQSGW